MIDAKNINEIENKLDKIRPHPIDEEYTKPIQGGCWICRRGNGWEESDKFEFISEEDAFYHSKCLKKLNINDEEELIKLIEELEEDK